MLCITWCILSTRVLSCGILTVVQIGFIDKYFSKMLKYHLNTDSFVMMNFIDVDFWIYMLD